MPSVKFVEENDLDTENVCHFWYFILNGYQFTSFYLGFPTKQSYSKIIEKYTRVTLYEYMYTNACSL